MQGVCAHRCVLSVPLPGLRCSATSLSPLQLASGAVPGLCILVVLPFSRLLSNGTVGGHYLVPRFSLNDQLCRVRPPPSLHPGQRQLSAPWGLPGSLPEILWGVFPVPASPGICPGRSGTCRSVSSQSSSLCHLSPPFPASSQAVCLVLGMYRWTVPLPTPACSQPVPPLGRGSAAQSRGGVPAGSNGQTLMRPCCPPCLAMPLLLHLPGNTGLLLRSKAARGRPRVPAASPAGLPAQPPARPPCPACGCCASEATQPRLSAATWQRCAATGGPP